MSDGQVQITPSCPMPMRPKQHRFLLLSYRQCTSIFFNTSSSLIMSPTSLLSGLLALCPLILAQAATPVLNHIFSAQVDLGSLVGPVPIVGGVLAGKSLLQPTHLPKPKLTRLTASTSRTHNRRHNQRHGAERHNLLRRHRGSLAKLQRHGCESEHRSVWQDR